MPKIAQVMSGDEVAEVRFEYSDSGDNAQARERSANNNTTDGFYQKNRELDAVAQILPDGDDKSLLGNNANEENLLKHVTKYGLPPQKNIAKMQTKRYTFFGDNMASGTLNGTIALKSSEADELEQNPGILKRALVAPKREIYAFQTYVDDTSITFDDTTNMDALKSKLRGNTRIEQGNYNGTAKLGSNSKTQRYVEKQEKQFLEYVKNNYSNYDGDIAITTSVHYLNNWFDHHWDCDINFLADDTKTDARMWWPRDESMDCLRQMAYTGNFDGTSKKWEKVRDRDKKGDRVAEIVHFVAMKSRDTKDDESNKVELGRYSRLERIVTSYCRAYASTTTYLPFLIPMPKNYQFKYHSSTGETSFSDEIAITQTLAGLRDANICPVFFPKSEGFDYVMFSREPTQNQGRQKIQLDADPNAVFFGPAYGNRTRNIPQNTFREYYLKRLGASDTSLSDGDILREWLVGTNVIVDHKDLVLRDKNKKGTTQSYMLGYGSVDPTKDLSQDYRDFIKDMYSYSEVNKFLYYGNYYDNNRRNFVKNTTSDGNDVWLDSNELHPSRHQFFMFSGNPETHALFENIQNKPGTDTSVNHYKNNSQWDDKVDWTPKTPLCFTPPQRKKKELSTFDILKKFKEDEGSATDFVIEPGKTSKDPTMYGIKLKSDASNKQGLGVLHSTSMYKYNPPFARMLSLRLFPTTKEEFKFKSGLKIDVKPTWIDAKKAQTNVLVKRNSFWERYVFLVGIYNFAQKSTWDATLFVHNREKIVRSTYFKFFLTRLSSRDNNLDAPTKIKKQAKSESQTKAQKTSRDLKTGQDNHLFLMRLGKYEKTLNSLLDLHGGRFEIFKDWNTQDANDRTENRAMWESIHNCGNERARVYWPRDNILTAMKQKKIHAWAFKSVDKETEISMRDDAWVFHNRFLSVGVVFVEFLQDLARSLGEGDLLADSLNIKTNFHEIDIPAILVPLYTERANPKYHMWSSFLAWQKIAADAIMEENGMDMEEKIDRWNKHVGDLEDNESPGYRSYLEERMSVLVDSFLARGGLI